MFQESLYSLEVNTSSLSFLHNVSDLFWSFTASLYTAGHTKSRLDIDSPTLFKTFKVEQKHALIKLMLQYNRQQNGNDIWFLCCPLLKMRLAIAKMFWFMQIVGLFLHSHSQKSFVPHYSLLPRLHMLYALR